LLDSVVKLTEKISELLRYRAERRGRRFKYLIEPMYMALKNVHQDYLSIFENSKRDLSSDLAFIAIADSLGARRLPEEAERRAILQQAEAMGHNESLADCRSFFKAVVDYFQETPFSGGNTPSSMLLQTLNDAANEHRIVQPLEPSGHSPRETLSKAIDLALEMLRRNWERVSSEYAKALAANVK